MKQQSISLSRLDNPEFLQDRYFYTKNGEKIDFKLTYLDREPRQNACSIWSLNAVQAWVNQEPAGYILLAYLNEEIKNSYFSNCTDYYIYKHDISSVIQARESHNPEEFLLALVSHIGFGHYEIEQAHKNNHYDEKFVKKHLKYMQRHMESLYSQEYNSFLNYWYLKPNVDIVTVYNQDDKTYKNFNIWPFTREPRPLQINNTYTNFRSQGIAQSLYEVAGLWMQSLNMHVNASDTQTPDGRKMWAILQQHPHFQVMTESFFTLYKKQANTGALNKDRQKLVVL